MHLLPYHLLTNIFPKHKRFGLLFFIGLLPFILRLIDSYLPYEIKYPLAFIAYFWIGFIFYLFLFSIILMFVKFFTDNISILQIINVLFFLFCIFITLYGYFNSKKIQLTKYSINSHKINKKYSLLFVSDIHIDLITDHNNIYKKIKNIIESNPPNIIILGGDIFEANIHKIQDKIHKTFDIFRGYKTFFIFGNHEHYSNNIKEIKEFLEKNGIILLRNSNYLIDNLNLMGVDDPAGHGRDSKELFESWLNNMSALIDKDKFNILISHRPWGFLEFSSQNEIDLQISGHTHNGQIYPFNYLVKLFYPFIYGKYTQDNTHLIVTMGFGTWGPPMRVFTKCEAVIIELAPE